MISLAAESGWELSVRKKCKGRERGDKSRLGFSCGEGLEGPVPVFIPAGNPNNNLAGSALLRWSQRQRCHFGVKLQFFPVFLSWSRRRPSLPLPAATVPFPNHFLFVSRSFAESVWQKGGDVQGLAGPGRIPQHPGGSRYPALPLPWERCSQIQPDELQNPLWV